MYTSKVKILKIRAILNKLPNGMSEGFRNTRSKPKCTVARYHKDHVVKIINQKVEEQLTELKS